MSAPAREPRNRNPFHDVVHPALARGGRLRKAHLALGGVALLIGLSLHGEQVWLFVKARIADELIRRAYARYRIDGNPHRPWRGADMHPIGRLVVPRLGVERMILAGASGESMAFGVGHATETAPPNENGICLLAGHRDGAFAFLARLRPDDRVRIDTHGSIRTYRVHELEVVAQDQGPFLDSSTTPRLALVTCYPFRSYRSSTRRYIIWCVPVTMSPATSPDTTLLRGPPPRPQSHGSVRGTNVQPRPQRSVQPRELPQLDRVASAH